MSIRFERGPDRFDGFDVIKIGKRIRWDALGLGKRVILDVCQDGDFPISFEATTGGLFFSARKHVSLLEQVKFRG
jgi:hypothetical protein